MTFDPQFAAALALMMAVGWTMCFAALRKHLLEPKQRRRICPSCGRPIRGRVCDAH